MKYERFLMSLFYAGVFTFLIWVFFNFNGIAGDTLDLLKST